MSSHTQSGMQQKAGTNFEGPKPVEPVAAAPAVAAGGGFAAMAARLAAAGGQQQQLQMQPKPKAATATSTGATSSAATNAPVFEPTCLTTSSSSAPRIVVLDSGALLSSGSVLLHGTSAGFELLARLYRESADAGAIIRFVTTHAVIAELKDERTRDMMAALPFQIEVLDVQPEAIKEGQ